jgi:hypothetical protein
MPLNLDYSTSYSGEPIFGTGKRLSTLHRPAAGFTLKENKMTNEKASPLDPATDAEVEKMIQDTGATAPRLTPDDIHAVITDESYCLLENTTTTICYLTLQNGFVVTGESACISPENFDQKIGCEVAYKQALGKIWMLEGYLMKQRIYEATELAKTYTETSGEPAAPGASDA